jgi:hypothetical protein
MHDHNFSRIKQHLNTIISNTIDEKVSKLDDVETLNLFYRIREAALNALCYIPEVNNLGNDREGTQIQQIHGEASEGHKSS